MTRKIWTWITHGCITQQYHPGMDSLNHTLPSAVPLKESQEEKPSYEAVFHGPQVKKGKQSKVHTSPSVMSDHVARLPGQVLKRNIHGE